MCSFSHSLSNSQENPISEYIIKKGLGVLVLTRFLQPYYWIIIFSLLLQGGCIRLDISPLRNSSSQLPNVSIEVDENIQGLAPIDIYGVCHEVSEVQVMLPPPSQLVPCLDGRWELKVDFNGYPDGAIEIVVNYELNGKIEEVRRTISKDSTPPLLNFLYPQKDDVLTIEEVATIRWMVYDLSPVISVELAYSLDDGFVWQDVGAGSFENSGAASWELPTSSSSFARLRLRAKDSLGNSAELVSEKFHIVEELLSPVVQISGFSLPDGSVVQDGDVVSFSYATSGEFLKDQSAEIFLSVDGGIVWSEIASNLDLNGTFDYTVSGELDVKSAMFLVKAFNVRGGEGRAISSSFVIDNHPPQVSDMKINNGAKYSITVFVHLTFDIFDSSVVKVAVKEIGAGQSCSDVEDSNGVPVNPLWRSWQSEVEDFGIGMQLSSLDGEKFICAWVKDRLERLAEAPIKRSIILETQNIPIITEFKVESEGQLNVQQGDDMLIHWSAEDTEGLSGQPLSLAFTTDGKLWLDVVSLKSIEDQDNITWLGNNTSLSKNVSDVYSLKAPSSEYFRLRGRVRDRAGNTSIVAFSDSFNTPQWQVYLGSTDRGDGGVGKSVLLRNYNSRGIFAIHPITNDIYFLDEVVGIRKLDIRTGLVSTVILLGETGTPMSPEGKTISFVEVKDYFTKGGIIHLGFNSKGLLYFNYNRSVYKIDLAEKKISWYLGGGSDPASLDLSKRSIWGGPIVFSKDDSLYVWDSCDSDFRYTAARRLLRVSENLDGTAGSFSVVYGGACSTATPNYGGAAASSPAGSLYYSQLISVVSIDEKNTIYITGYNMAPVKIINGVVRRAEFTSSTVLGSYRTIYNPITKKLFATGDSEEVLEITPNYSGDNGEIVSTYISSNPTAQCYEDGRLRVSACVSVSQEIRVDSEGTLFIADGTGLNRDAATRIRYIDRSDLLQTLVGSLSFFGNGYDKSLARGQITSIAYNQEDKHLTFPKGLYFTDAFGMVLAYADEATSKVSTLWGNQTGLRLNIPGPMVTSYKISPQISMGAGYNGLNGSFITFDENGELWLRSENALTKIRGDGYIDYKQPSIVSGYFNFRSDLDRPSQLTMAVGAGSTNLEIFSNKAIFMGGYFNSDPSGGAYNTIAEMSLFDFGSDVITDLMGRKSGVLANTDPSPAIAGVPARTAHFVSDCLDARNQCFQRTVLGDVPLDDRVYFSERNRLRYIEKPFAPSESILRDLFVLPPNQEVRNFIFNIEKSRIYYLLSDGQLYCYSLSGSESSCDGTSLYPYADRMGKINACSNQLTWKDSKTLLISNCQGEVLQYSLP